MARLIVEGMASPDHANRVEAALRDVEGVEAVSVDYESGSASVEGTAPVAAMAVAVREVGCDVATCRRTG